MLNLDKIRENIKDGYISERKHPTLPLYIYNYTTACQIESKWNRETVACRGLILHESGKIVARPFKKFFNIEEIHGSLRNYLRNLYGIYYSEIFTTPFTAFEKLDGSLGILYWDGRGNKAIATRGSFESNQAQYATKILNDKYSNVIFDYKYTYLFEIIYPDNRIVVDYGGVSDLYLIGIVNTETGEELSVYDENFAHLPFPRPKTYEIHSLDHLEAYEQAENEEGFVLFFPAYGFRAKFKFSEYKRLHKIMTGVTPKRVLDQLRAGKSLDEWLDKVPDEFYQEIEKIALDFQGQYDKIESEYEEKFRSIFEKTGPDRKAFALEAVKTRHSSIMFALYDCKSYKDLIWNVVEKGLNNAVMGNFNT